VLTGADGVYTVAGIKKDITVVITSKKTEETPAGNVLIFNADDLATGDIKADYETVAGEHGTTPGFKLLANEEKSFTVDAEKQTFTIKGSDITVTNRLKTGGKSTDNARRVEFTAEEAGKVYVAVKNSSGSSARSVSFIKKGASEDLKKIPLAGGAKEVAVFDIAEAGTYQLYAADGAINFYYIRVDYDIEIEPDEDENVTVTFDYDKDQVEVSGVTLSDNKVTISANSTLSFNAVAKEGFEIERVTAGNAVLTAEDGVYTVADIKKDITVVITSKKTGTEPGPGPEAEEYTITLDADSSKVEVTGVTDGQKVSANTAVEFTAKAKTGYKDLTVEVLVSGNKVTVANSGDTYTIAAKDVTGDITIKVDATKEETTPETEGATFWVEKEASTKGIASGTTMSEAEYWNDAHNIVFVPIVNKSKIESGKKSKFTNEAEAELAGDLIINAQGTLYQGAYFAFTAQAGAKVTVYWLRGGGSKKRITGIRNADGSVVEGVADSNDAADEAATVNKNGMIDTFTVPADGTYVVGSIGEDGSIYGGNSYYRVDVDKIGSKVVDLKDINLSSTPKADEFDITIPAAEKANVVITVDGKAATKAAAGAAVKVAPAAGKQIDSIKVTDKSGKEVAVTKNEDGSYSFNMPEGGLRSIAVVTSDVKSEDTDAKIVIKDEDGNVTSDATVETGKVDGEDVYFITPAAGKKFDGKPVVTVDGKEIEVLGPDDEGRYYFKADQVPAGADVQIGVKTNDVKEDETASDNKTPREKAEDAINSGKGSLADDEVVVIATSNGKKFTYTVSLNAAVSGNSTGTLTLQKGDKVMLPGYNKKTSGLSVNKKLVAVSGKGLLKAKKATGAAGTSLKYTAGNVKVDLKVVVVEPSLKVNTVSAGSISGNSVAGVGAPKKLKVVINSAGVFDIGLDAPLTAVKGVLTAKVKTKGGVVADDTKTYITVDENGKLHITGKASGKGSLKIPYSVYGKKYNIVINAKI
jgi:hypothetical protein